MIATEVADALHGAVDLHCHPGPNPFRREFDHVEAVRDGARLHMRAILMKSHHHNTVMDLLAVQPLLAGLETAAFGGIALNAQVGGINPYAVAMSLRMGGKAVWFPTLSSRQHHGHGPRRKPDAAVTLPDRVVEINGDDGSLTSDVHDVLDLVAESDALLSSGHLGITDAREVFRAGREHGVRRMVISHPNHVVDASTQDCRELAADGVFIEHEIGAFDPQGPIGWDPAELLRWIREVGVEHTVLASDLGQKGRAMPVDGFLRVGAELLERGLTPAELRRMACTNPAHLLGLDSA